LPLAGVGENAIGARTIAVAILAAGFARKKENEGNLLRCRNAALTLAAID